MLFLVVDDDTLSRELLKLLLEVEGHEVEAVMSGEAAVERVAAGTGHLAAPGAKDRLPLPSVILTDIQMPGLAGDSLARALRVQLDMHPETTAKNKIEAEPGHRTLLLAMSGSRPAPSELVSFDGFLLKPFTSEELKAIVQSTMRGTAPIPALRVAAPVEPVESIASRGEGGSAGPAGGPTASLSDVLDEEIYARMRDLMPLEQLGQMYTLCVDDARRRIARMGELAAEKDDAAYRKEAHAVKGGSGMIGACELYALAAAAEQDGLTPSLPRAGTTSVTATLAQLSLACDRLERILQERTRE